MSQPTYFCLSWRLLLICETPMHAIAFEHDNRPTAASPYSPDL